MGFLSRSSAAPAASAPSTPGKKEPEIIVIPEKFYGVALKLPGLIRSEPVEKPVPPPPPPAPKPPLITRPPERRSLAPMIGLVIFLVLAVGSGFVYFNRALLFPKPAPPVVVPPKTVPSAPTNLTAATSSAAVSLSWLDAAPDEMGYRIERREENGTYLPLTILPPNSTAFLDVSVQASKTYAYRVLAMGEAGDSAPSNEVSAMVAAAPLPPPAAPTLPPGGLDSDSDGLSDVEEPLYGTDTRNPDTDADGFLDGNEVFHLYNPAARAPVRLLDSGLVKVFSGPAGWNFLIPTSWTATLTVADGSQATVTTGSGESFAIRIESNPQNLPLMDWYLAGNPGVLSSNVRSFTTKGGLAGVLSADRLDAYFAWGGKIFSLRYALNNQPFINYRTTFEMILNSLKLNGVPLVTVPTDASGGPGALVGETAPAATSPSTIVVTPTATSTATSTRL